MGECSICGGKIQSGVHHSNTTDCIRFLRERIARLEALVTTLVPPGAMPPGVPVKFQP